MAPAAKQSTPGLDCLEDASSPVRVLVVDDHEIFRASIRQLLGGAGIDVVGEAESGEQALQLVGELQPDVVLMDINMPGIGGVEATRRIVRLAPEARVLIFTISAEEEDVVEAVLAGACGYLLKTVPPEQLVTGIQAAAAGESVVSPSVTAQLLRRLRNGEAGERLAATEPQLSPRERQILELIAQGKENAEIARELYVSPKTIKNTITRLLRKLGLRNRTEAAVYAARRGLR